MRIVPSFVLVALAACAAPEPVPPGRAEAVERQFLQPFLDGGEIGCGELVIEITGNFFENVSQPAVDSRRHGVRKEQHDGYSETIWLNKVGDLPGFVVAIGATDEFTEKGYERGPHTKFTVLHQVTLRVFEGKHPMTLSVEAKGPPLVRSVGNAVQDLREYRVENGAIVQQ